jgi:hypothetical protein
MRQDRKELSCRGKEGIQSRIPQPFDEVILFQSLSDADLIQIVELLVQQFNANLAQKAITIAVTEEAKKWILEKTLVDRSYGARPLRRALQRFVEDPLSEALIAGKISDRPAFLEVYLDNNQLFYRPVSASDETAAKRSRRALASSATEEELRRTRHPHPATMKSPRRLCRGLFDLCRLQCPPLRLIAPEIVEDRRLPEQATIAAEEPEIAVGVFPGERPPSALRVRCWLRRRPIGHKRPARQMCRFR